MSKIMAKIVKASGEIVDISPKNRKDFQLDEVQQIVGGYVEAIRINDEEFMLVDEEGKLNAKPINVKATAYYCANKRNACNDFIVGDVLLCSTSEFL